MIELFIGLDVSEHRHVAVAEGGRDDESGPAAGRTSRRRGGEEQLKGLAALNAVSVSAYSMLIFLRNP